MGRIDTILLRRGTTAEWTAANPVLLEGEPGLDKTTGAIKIGDGSSNWASLLVSGILNITTMADMTLYVDNEATGNGNGLSWTNACTTFAAAVAKIPYIVRHNVVIVMRKRATPYRETIIVPQRAFVGNNSVITVRGEYYWNNRAGYVTGTTENTTANRLYKYASDSFTNVEVGDKICLSQYSGTYDGSYPTNAYYGYVSDVSAKASGYITVAMDASVTPTTAWNYMITKTVIDGSNDGSTPVRTYGILVCCNNATILGLTIINPLTAGIQLFTYATGYCNIVNCNIYSYAKYGIVNTVGNVYLELNSVGIIGVSTTPCAQHILQYRLSIIMRKVWMFGVSSGVGGSVIQGHYSADISIERCLIRSTAADPGNGILIYGQSHAEITYSTIMGLNSSNKLACALVAAQGSTIISGGCNLDSNTITTLRSPALLSADGSIAS